jgi:superfamily II DNA or RNA helicase
MSNIVRKLKIALEQCAQLNQENNRLKEILKFHNIPYTSYETTHDFPKLEDKISPREAQIKERIQLFKSLFRGRTDVYAKRWENRDGSQSGYAPACSIEWHPTLCNKPKIKCGECPNRKFMPLTDQIIFNHLIGKQTIGIYPLLKDDTCWFLAVDFDKNNWQEDCKAFVHSCRDNDIHAYIERSRSGKGGHVWIFFKSPISASLARKLGNFLLARTLEKRYQVGIESYDRLFPNQDTLPQGGFGNLIALPLQREPREYGNSIFVDGGLNPISDQWEYLSNVQKVTSDQITRVLNNSKNTSNFFTEKSAKSEISVMKDIPSNVNIIIRNGVYIEKNLPSFLMSKIAELATFKNPEFYKAQSKRLSTHGIPRIINCLEDDIDHVILPRGCQGELDSLLEKYSIEKAINVQQNIGMKIDVSFKGLLTSQQEEAVTNLLNYDTGILAATTGFGKTVTAASLIARRKVNTLIIVHRKQLLDQWKEKLSTFLEIEPKSIGQIGGGKNKPTGKIDIATIQSLNYKGKIKQDVNQYGQIIVDECHHISAYSFERVLQFAEAKYIHGLTATPTRKDGLHPIMFMQCGPIRYKVDAKNQAKVRPFAHYLKPRQTNFSSAIKEENKTVHNLYAEIITNEKRNNLIFDDVLKALDKGRKPILLTERIDHVNYFTEKFDGFVKKIIVLTGGQNKRDEDKALKDLKETPDDQERLIIATGKYIGEGFDDTLLDTLFLAMPVSWKGTLQQYVGRLHRLHDRKQSVEVYDYVDHREPILSRMYENRLKAYKSLGYHIKNENDQAEQMRLF